jgi:hypothetical protein
VTAIGVRAETAACELPTREAEKIAGPSSGNRRLAGEHPVRVRKPLRLCERFGKAERRRKQTNQAFIKPSPASSEAYRMRHFRAAAALTLIILSPSIAGAASWQPAPAGTVHAGVTSSSTFVIAAYVTLPQDCYAARIRASSSVLSRSFVVEQMPTSSRCTGKTAYHCTVVSPEFRLPIAHKFNVHSQGKMWEVTLAATAPAPLEPMCRKP